MDDGGVGAASHIPPINGCCRDNDERNYRAGNRLLRKTLLRKTTPQRAADARLVLSICLTGPKQRVRAMTAAGQTDKQHEEAAELGRQRLTPEHPGESRVVPRKRNTGGSFLTVERRKYGRKLMELNIRECEQSARKHERTLFLHQIESGR